MAKLKDRIACTRCGWDGEARIWGGRVGPFQRNADEKDVTDPMKRKRAVPPSWRDGVCAYCRWKEARSEPHQP